VPDVVGRTEAVARRAIESVGLVAGVVTQPDLVVRRGLVVRLEPGPGTAVLEGSTVRVVVSSGRLG